MRKAFVAVVLLAVGCASSPYARPESRPMTKTPESAPESVPESASAESKPAPDGSGVYSSLTTARERMSFDGSTFVYGFRCDSGTAAERIESIRKAIEEVLAKVRELEAYALSTGRTPSPADALRFKEASEAYATLCRDTATICASLDTEIACDSALSTLLFAAELYAEALSRPPSSGF